MRTFHFDILKLAPPLPATTITCYLLINALLETRKESHLCNDAAVRGSMSNEDLLCRRFYLHYKRVVLVFY